MGNFDGCNTLEEIVFQALGAASACWEHLDRAGVFESDRCLAIGNEAVERIKALYAEGGK